MQCRRRALGTLLLLSSLARGASAQGSCASWAAGLFSDQGLNGAATALAVFDDGTGPALYAGGFFTVAGSALATHVARWDGTTMTWAPLGLGTDSGVSALAVYDDGSGPALYAAGQFAYAGGSAAARVAKW